MMMVVAPETVRRDKLAEAHGPAHWTLSPATVARFRSFRDATPSGVIGDARRATPEKGDKLIAACRDGLIAVLRDPQLWQPPAPGRPE
jgi:creatinine amidohydrolase